MAGLLPDQCSVCKIIGESRDLLRKLALFLGVETVRSVARTIIAVQHLCATDLARDWRRGAMQKGVKRFPRMGPQARKREAIEQRSD